MYYLKIRIFTTLITLLLMLCFISNLSTANGQFWKLNSQSNRDLFILETKSLMASGICYKEVEAEASEPTLKVQTISFCCPGYRRSFHSCVPICSEDCSNGICTAPDVCECYPGFARAGGRCEEL